MAQDAHLTHDDELEVLWLTHGSQELALSCDGVWLRSGRTTLELTWGEVDQVQAVASRGLGRRDQSRVEFFVEDDRVQIVGPFPASAADEWVAAAAVAAREGGHDVLGLRGASGFAIRGRDTPAVEVRERGRVVR